MQFDLFASEQAKAFMKMLPHGWIGTGEDIRRFLIEEMQLEPPHHHNAWGSLIRTAVHRGLIGGTGRWTRMRGPKSHARPTQIYRVGRSPNRL